MVIRNSRNNQASTNLLRCVAIFLIANSHLDHYYPISQLGTGGAIGNALFFMLSGYGLALSPQLQKQPFIFWYRRRIGRIYPSLIIAVSLLVILREKAWHHWDVKNYIENLIWPTPYWFIAALMLFYVIFFIVAKQNNARMFLAGIIALVIPYGYFYVTMIDLTRYSVEGPGYFKWIVYLQLMLYGGYLSNINTSIRGRIITDGLLLLLCIVVYFGILLLVNRGYGGQFQAVSQLLMFPMMLLFLKVSRSDFICNTLLASEYGGAAISLVAGLTLEIYLLHGVVYSNSSIQSVIFPLNLAAFWITVICMSYMLNRVASFFTHDLLTFYQNHIIKHGS